MFRFSAVCLLATLLSDCSGIHLNKPNNLSVQNAPSHLDSLSNYPLWINMMNDPHAHYEQTLEAFNLYWSKHEAPTEKDGEARDIFNKEKNKEEKEKEEHRSLEFVMEYKQFLNWQQKYKNLVKPDGTIMSDEEIIKQSELERLSR